MHARNKPSHVGVLLQRLGQQVARCIALQTGRGQPPCSVTGLAPAFERHSREREPISFRFDLGKALEVLGRSLLVVRFLAFGAVRADEPQVSAVHVQALDVDFLFRGLREFEDAFRSNLCGRSRPAARVIRWIEVPSSPPSQR